MDKLTINRWAEEDRPREKMISKGAQALTNAELLAILIGSGNDEDSAVGLMQKVLADGTLGVSENDRFVPSGVKLELNCDGSDADAAQTSQDDESLYFD